LTGSSKSVVLPWPSPERLCAAELFFDLPEGPSWPGWPARSGGNDRPRQRCAAATSAEPSGTPRRSRSRRPERPAATPWRRVNSQPLTPLVSPAVDDAQRLAGIQVHDGCHQRLEPRPRSCRWVPKVADRPELVFIDAQHPGADVGEPQQADLIQRGADHPPGYANPAAVSEMAMPERAPPSRFLSS
jgi:hypothetical protein